MNAHEREVISNLRDGVNALLINNGNSLPKKMKDKYMAAIKEADDLLNLPICIRCKDETANSNNDTLCLSCSNL